MKKLSQTISREKDHNPQTRSGNTVKFKQPKNVMNLKITHFNLMLINYLDHYIEAQLRPIVHGNKLYKDCTLIDEVWKINGFSKRCQNKKESIKRIVHFSLKSIRNQNEFLRLSVLKMIHSSDCTLTQ